MSLQNIVTTIRNFIVSSKTNALIEEQNYLINLQMSAEHLKKYSDALIEQKNRTEPSIEEISHAARDALTRIARRTDMHSKSFVDDNRTATRHVFIYIVRHLFNAFSYEMTWQTTENLYSRFTRIVNLQIDYEEFNPHSNKIDLKKAYEKQQRVGLEGKLFGSKEFVELLTTFFNRFTLPEQLYQDVLNEAEPVFILIRKHKDLFKEEISKISSLRKDNKLEIVKIENDSNLSYEYLLLESKLKFIENSYRIEMLAKYDTEELRLSQVLIIGFLCIMLERQCSWGYYIET